VKKGIDVVLFKAVTINKRTGKIHKTKLAWRRPEHGIKVLAARAKAKKAAKQARKRNR
jgi:hypothetical protein